VNKHDSWELNIFVQCVLVDITQVYISLTSSMST